MRDITTLTSSDMNRILTDAPNKCYSQIAEEMDIGIHTVKRVVRKCRLKRYG
jgi:transposase